MSPVNQNNAFANLHQPNVDEHARQSYVTNLFDGLAPRYDRFNRWVSLFRDEAWRKQTLNALAEQRNGVILDLAAGTGDLSRSALRMGAKQVHVFDISHEMLRTAQVKLKQAPAEIANQACFEQGSAHRLPFRDDSLDAVVSGFAMRNVFHFLDDVLQEIHRVVKPNGRVSILELSRPQNSLLRFGFRLHMSKVMPLIGRLATGSSSPFQYLYQTTMTFLTPTQFSESLQAAGFVEVTWQAYLLGGIAVHSCRKP